MDGRRQEADHFWRLVVLVIAAITVIVLLIACGRKAWKQQGAFFDWRPVAVAVFDGVDVYAEHHFPNSPIVAVFLYPFALLPPFLGGLAFALVKITLAAIAVYWAIDIARGARSHPPWWAIGLILLLSLRPIEADMQHGNINIFILFFVMAGLRAFTRDRRMLAGVLIGLATVVKVTPALFILYFIWKRQWRTVAGCGAGILGAVLLPALLIGPWTNVELHHAWFNYMIAPYVVGGEVFYTDHMNQSMPGLVFRLVTDIHALHLNDGAINFSINFLALEPGQAQMVVRVLLLAVVVWLAFACRTPAADRGDWRLACEFGLILIAMLILSERTWKPHFVTIALPVACTILYLLNEAPPPWLRRLLIAALAGFFLLTVCTSDTLIGWIYHGVAHKFLEAMGSFLLAGLLLFIGLSAILIRERRRDAVPATIPDAMPEAST